MSQSYEGMPGIDPTVDKYLQDFVDDLDKDSVPSRHFGDQTIIEAPKSTVLPGETPAEAHIRLQKENAEDLND